MENKSSYDKDIDKIISMVNSKRDSKDNVPPQSTASHELKNKKYVSDKKLRNKKANKIPKALSLLLAAGILAGSIGVITLNHDNDKSSNLDKNLEESQQKLYEILSNENSFENIESYQEEDNSLAILNVDLNSLLQRYESNPSSVTQEEVKSLLKTAYLEGRSIISSKMADAYNEYSKENNDYPTNISPNDLVYRSSNAEDHMTPYFMEYCPNYYNSPNGTALPSNNQLSNIIKSQLRMQDLYLSDTTLDLEESIEALKKGITAINECSASNFEITDSFLGSKKLEIKDLDKSIDSSDFDYEDR